MKSVLEDGGEQPNNTVVSPVLWENFRWKGCMYSYRYVFVYMGEYTGTTSTLKITEY
eukprot:SAG22_NODE_6192_length_887_cov_2.049492_1_plen_57_part_00